MTLNLSSALALKRDPSGLRFFPYYSSDSVLTLGESAAKRPHLSSAGEDPPSTLLDGEVDHREIGEHSRDTHSIECVFSQSVS